MMMTSCSYQLVASKFGDSLGRMLMIASLALWQVTLPSVWQINPVEALAL
jgi:hypothetical protein